MPYPIAHPAAVIPLVRLMGRFASPSALVIGSMVPDLWYFVPGAERWLGHVLPALLWFCLPVGLLVYAAFHLLFKYPLIALLPDAMASRAAAYATRGMPAVPRVAVVLSLLAGGSTHLAWDALTHESSTSLWLLPGLSEPLLAIGQYTMNVYQVLQHSSTLIGAAIVVFWVQRKLLAATPAQVEPRTSLPPGWRAGIVAGLIAIPALVVLGIGMDALSGGFDLLALRKFIRTAGIAALSALALGVVAYCAGWHVFRLRGTMPLGR